METETQPPPVKEISASELVREHAAAMPPPNEHAIRSGIADASGSASAPPPETGPVDKGGAKFDAARHLPKMHPKTGRWLPRRASKATETAAAGQPAPSPGSYVPPDPAPPPPPRAPDEAEQAGAAVAVSIILAGVMLFGDEWAPQEGQQDAIAKGWAEYFRQTGVSKPPPWIAAAIPTVAYVAQNVVKPKTQTKLQKIRLWIVDKWARWRAGRVARAVNP